MTPEQSDFAVRRATPRPEPLGRASSTLQPSEGGLRPRLPNLTTANVNKMATKRNAHSSPGEAQNGEQRECHQRHVSKSAGSLDELAPTSSTSTSTSTGSAHFCCVPASNPQDPTQVSPPCVERRPPLSTNNSSSRMSVASSLYSTSSSTASEPQRVADSDDLLSEEPPSPGLAPDGMPLPEGAPHNFGTVIPGLYRSGYPRPENYEFIQKLGLKTIVTLVDKNFTPEYEKFISINGIRHHIIRMKGTKKEDIPLATMEAILSLVLDKNNYPLLIHCNHGKHRTGCVVAIVRKIAGWNTDRAIDEYKAYAGIKMRDVDVDYIGKFNLATIPDVVANCNVDFRAAEREIEFARIPTLILPWARIFRTVFLAAAAVVIWTVTGTKMASRRQ